MPKALLGAIAGALIGELPIFGGYPLLGKIAGALMSSSIPSALADKDSTRSEANEHS